MEYFHFHRFVARLPSSKCLCSFLHFKLSTTSDDYFNFLEGLVLNYLILTLQNLSCISNTKISCFSEQSQNTCVKIPSEKVSLDNQLSFAITVHLSRAGG